MMIMRLVNQASKIRRQRKVISDLMKELEDKKHIIDFLYEEIAKRDQKIIEQQKRMRFFGIEIGSFYYKNLKKGVYMQGRIKPEGNS